MHDSPELKHYGILGMHWHRRKEQHAQEYKSGLEKTRLKAEEDARNQGLTIRKAGKHVKKAEHEYRKDYKEQMHPKSPEHNKKLDLKKKHISEMSNAELKALNERMQLEKQYKELTKTDTRVARGEKFAKEIITSTGKELIKETLKTAIKTKMKG